MLSYNVSDESVKKLKEINQKFEHSRLILATFSEDKKAFIRNQSYISNIGASTRIENAILTNEEIEWIDTEILSEPHQEFLNKKEFILNKISKDKERSLEEVAGYRNSLHIIFTTYKYLYPLKEADLKGLHREMLKYYSKAEHFAGEYKTQSNSVIEKNQANNKINTVLKTADPGVITETSMRDLLTWYNENLRTFPWVVSVAAEFIFRFLAIHPFQDGNGRLSRLLFQLTLISTDEACFQEIVPYLGLDRNIEKTRKEYYLMLRKCSNGVFSVDSTKYQYQYLLDYFCKILLDSLKNIDFYAQKYDNYLQLSNTAFKVLACFKSEPEITMQTKDLVFKLNIPRRTIIYSLETLVEKNFLQKLGQGAGLRYKLIF